eukprot:gene8577-17693_t
MTYSRPTLERIKLNSFVNDNITYSLWKHESSNKKTLNPQPVLFIHGHDGQVEQVRSLASYMHNNGTLQYFAISAKDPYTAYHSSSILRQAVFVNDAIYKIRSLYTKQFNTEPPKVMIVGHSYGGVVARAAVFLSNHPKCAVSTIITLGTPSHRASYTPDASHDQLLQYLNQAWRASFYFQSQTCLANVTADWTCNRCVPKITLVSISGGDIDNLVPSSITNLVSSIPKPSNRSSESPTPTKLRNALRPKGGWVAFVVRSFMEEVNSTAAFTGRMLSYVGLMKKTAVNSTNTTTSASGSGKVDNDMDEFDVPPATDASQDVNTDSNTSDTATATSTSKEDVLPKDNNHTTTNTTSSVPVSMHVKRLRAISMEQWTSQMTPMHPPRILSLKTSQLAAVGFPVDHVALVWCSEVLQVVTHGLLSLSQSQSKKSQSVAATAAVTSISNHLEAITSLEKLFPVRNEFLVSSTTNTSSGTSIPSGLIEPLEATLRYDVHIKQFTKVADYEKIHFSNVLHSILFEGKYNHEKQKQKQKQNDASYNSNDSDSDSDRSSSSSSSGSILRGFSTWWSLATILYTSHLGTIFLCYVITSALMLSVPIWRGLANIHPLYPANNIYKLLSPWNGSFVMVLHFL